MQKGEMTLDRFGLPELIAPLVGVGKAPDRGAAALLEGMNNIFVTTSTLDDVFTSWRIAATTRKTGKRRLWGHLRRSLFMDHTPFVTKVSLRHRGLGSATVLCQAILGSWASVCTLLGTFLKLSTPTPGG